jgi:hypothetical protein
MWTKASSSGWSGRSVRPIAADGPAEFGISPVRAVDLSLTYTTRALIRLYPVMGICPGTPIRLSTPQPVRRSSKGPGHHSQSARPFRVSPREPTLLESRSQRQSAFRGFCPGAGQETHAGEQTTWNNLEICPQESFEEDLTGITYF